jgi:hypothetical protein
MRILAFLVTVCLSFITAESAFALPSIVFVTQAPHPDDFATVNSTFGNHRASLDSVPRGGDLYIRYSDGSLKNITQSAGFGMSGLQGSNGIAVRDPAVHWDGNKILFSMVIGAPTQRYQVESYVWQLYEVTGIGKNQTPVITKVPNQPENYNNVMGTYGTDDRIIFASDRPIQGLTHTYPQRDEYESTATNTGLLSLDPNTGDIFQLDHSPSGDFHPFVDSFGRVIFTRWDHLQRDQQNRCSQPGFQAFNFESEASDAGALDTDEEVFPEARADCEKPGGSNLDNHTLNFFLPWQANEDGTELETLNHVGRHELAGYLGKSFNDDPNVEEFYGQYSRANQLSIDGFFQIQEDPTSPGTYFGISSPEFSTHASGQIIRTSAAPNLPADSMIIDSITHPDTQNTDSTPSADHIGFSRDPLPLSDGTLVAAHAGASTLEDDNTGTSQGPASRYAYRLRQYTTSGQYKVPASFLTPGITKSIAFWSPDEMVSYNNVTLWELQPREIRARTRPTRRTSELANPELSVLTEMGVSETELRDYLKDNNLALIVSRNVTTRDNLDHQQPLNLKVAGSSTQTVKEAGKIYDVAHLQIFQGDLIRGYGGIADPQDGRRVIAQPLHSVNVNPANPNGPEGSVQIAYDGSMAAFVPARRALTYQLTDAGGVGVVRERLWLSFQPGEIRVCASCHGVNSEDQIGAPSPENSPEALRLLLSAWKQIPIQAPGMDLEVTKAKGKKNPKTGKKSPKLRFRVSATNDYSANRSVSIYASVNGESCGQLKEFDTDANGAATFLSRGIPNAARRNQLTFTLRYSSRTLDEESIMLGSKATNKPKTTQKICAALQKALNE